MKGLSSKRWLVYSLNFDKFDMEDQVRGSDLLFKPAYYFIQPDSFLTLFGDLDMLR